MNNTTRQIGAALGVAILGTLLNSTYIAKINAVKWPVPLPSQAIEAIRSSIQGAHIVAQKVPYPQLSQMIINKSNEAFVSGTAHAMIISGIILAVASVVTVIILPSRVRAPKAEPEIGKQTMVKE
jgi:phosphotransferase system  glucose/maltose/N-acetylglucosamine-specific IIC component